MKTKTATLPAFRLEDNLLLFPYIANKLGLSSASDFARFKDVPEGMAPGENNTNMFFALLITPNIKISLDKLRQYDMNIQRYQEALSVNRTSRVSLKYFQYLAALFSEIYLDEYFKDPTSLLNNLNEFAESRPNPIESFSRRNLRKIAFWMATGSGKTFIMHINYWQFLKYNRGPNKIDIETVILITPPGDLLAKQHLDELHDSGIKAEIFEGDTRGTFFAESEEERVRVRIIEITKLKLPEDKKGKGEGVTFDVSKFSTRNLVLVDEGHKGHATEDRKWKRIRQALGQDGFTVEYSATFGQAIDRGNTEDVMEYSKCIVFNYSYKYFFSAGYGKDFQIHYLDTSKFNPDLIETVLLANTLVFYEQMKLYQAKRQEFRDYNISMPLWIFIGHRVQEDKSDLRPILDFFGKIISNRDWAVAQTRLILDGKSGLIGTDQRDLFARQTPERILAWLRNSNVDEKTVVDEILHDIFHLPEGSRSGKLHLVDVRNAAGQIGLRVNDSKLFGLIDIGNKSEFLTYIKETALRNFVVDVDTFTQSLYKSIEDEDSSINILIGAKKFIEGWNSWRVSCMGLLNVGRNEGSQIIQLFGRGVRLKGKNNSLKRSRALQIGAPPLVEILETLNIFGIRANYLETFRAIIKAEEVPDKDIPIETRTLEPFPEGLFLLRLKKPREEFVKESSIVFEPGKLEVKVDLLPRAKVIYSKTDVPMYVTDEEDLHERTIPDQLVSLLDWDLLLSSLLRVKKERGWANLLISADTLRKVILEKKYKLYCNDDVLRVERYADLARINELAILILTKYLDRSYISWRRNWERNNVGLTRMTNTDPAINRGYTVKVKETDTATIDAITSLRDSDKIYGESGPGPVRNIYFNRHIFQPLLEKMSGNVTLTPDLINEGEREFVQDLKDYLTSRPQKYADKSVYLMRNLSRGSGIGFIEEDSFYPDFILWVVDSQGQIISFIDPKGLIFLESLNDFKLTLYQYLQKEVSPKLGVPNVYLNAFIVSDTPFSSLQNKYRERETKTIEDYEERHILFQRTQDNVKNPNYIDKMFDILKVDAGKRPE